MDVAGLHVQVITPVYLIATKFEAFHERGGGEVVSSHDVEDIIAVIDGRTELVDEVRSAPPTDARTYVASRWIGY